MSTLNLKTMRQYLGKSIASLNKNKVNGILAEIDFRNTLIKLGYGARVSQGGWIFRSVGDGAFGHHTIVLFPMQIDPGIAYPTTRKLEDPPLGLHTICSTMHQIGVHSYYCVPSIGKTNSHASILWNIKQLGIPQPLNYSLLTSIPNFTLRGRPYNFLRHNAKSSIIPDVSVADEFTKEHLRISFQNQFICETSDIDCILWGQQYTYPIEVKEKTVAHDKKVGYYFGLDLGPFVKLAFYAAKKGNLHSIFIVREIDDPDNRNLIGWWFITFDILAQYASWVSQGGGTGMHGARSTVVKIPKSEFKELTTANLSIL